MSTQGCSDVVTPELSLHSQIVRLDCWQASNDIFRVDPTEFKATFLRMSASLMHIFSSDTHTTFCDNEETDRGEPSTTKLSKLHIYLPSSLCDDEEKDAKTEVMRYDLMVF